MKIHHLIIGGMAFAAVSALATQGTFELPALPETVSAVSRPVQVTPAKQNPAETDPAAPKPEKPAKPEPPNCVFKTAFEAEGIDPEMKYPVPAKVERSLERSLDWLADAQNNDGGWGAGSHSRQDIKDPHAVKSDPATTAMVAMGILRNGSTLHSGPYHDQLSDATEFLLECVENSPKNDLNITSLTGTQPQVKLGKNIDVALTSQYLTNLLDHTSNDPQLQARIKKAVKICVDKIEKGQTANGSQSGSGWAGVLQSSLATNALESAKDEGVEVNEETLDAARDYQKNNIDVKTNNVATESAAGIVLYSVSGSARASAQEAGEAKDAVKKAKKEGKLEEDAEITVENLEKTGMSRSKAMKYTTAYRVNESAKQIAQKDEVMSGFGNNGGEEFLSYLQTGEGLIMSKDESWKNWYDKMSGRLLQIQNNDGSWSGHHCITSPVFCTATSILILGICNDVESLAKGN
jgi:Squalene-hopene cyclase C-terminal domain